MAAYRSGDDGWWRAGQIVGLEDEADVRRERQLVAVVDVQGLAVVEHAAEVLGPTDIEGAVERQPRAALVLSGTPQSVYHCRRQQHALLA